MTDAVQLPSEWLRELYAELHGSDRACAVIAATTLDESLATLLQTHLLPAQRPKEDRLLGRGGIVDSFSSRIELTCRLGLISDVLRNALEDLRDIRNQAAHKAEFSFAKQSVAVRVERMHSSMQPCKHLPTGLITELGTSSKAMFVSTALLIALALEYAIQETQRTAAKPKDFLSLNMRWRKKDDV